MTAPFALKWGPRFYVALAVLLVLGVGSLSLSIGWHRPFDIAIVGIVPLLFAATCLLCAHRLSKLQATVIRPMKIVWAASLGLLAHGLLALVVTGITYATDAGLSSVEVKNLIFASIEFPVGLILVTISARMRRSAAGLVQEGVLS